jgi:hypothetical protein
MKQKKLRHIRHIRCECDQAISIRALARHLRAARWPHSKDFTDNCIKLINWQKIDRQAWLVTEGVNAKGDPHWVANVLNGECKLEDLVFVCPRPLGRNTPQALSKISKERVGKGNPSLKNKSIYNINEIAKWATLIFKNLGSDPARFKLLDAELNKKFPDYRYSFVGMFPKQENKRGYNRRNMILALIINKPIEWVVEQKGLDRGKFIQIGQRKSKKFDKMRCSGRGSLKSFISLPHYCLYNMILSVDPGAIMERQIDCGKTWKSYDIFSPKLNMLIEMHGYVWHDWHKCKSKMLPLVEENVRNDVVKMLLADIHGYKLSVFWDDQTDKWEKQIKELYGKEPKKYEQAFREESDRKEERRSLRHIDAI